MVSFAFDFPMSGDHARPVPPAPAEPWGEPWISAILSSPPDFLCVSVPPSNMQPVATNRHHRPESTVGASLGSPQNPMLVLWGRSLTNRPDDPEYTLRLIGQVITVSLETVEIVNALPDLSLSKGENVESSTTAKATTMQ